MKLVIQSMILLGAALIIVALAFFQLCLLFPRLFFVKKPVIQPNVQSAGLTPT